ncbi:hypothetical protein PUMCH_001362 [Australozyma saopauloensis]|uniref:Uncharacterized protein n=1 Tax=Australozyma saopauloensis TaxID=291208 RepID=A0AAX4H6H4_9ASCO|nr:hypothetical protein PUMCH_001362 [[Candida] saopauloensis]
MNINSIEESPILEQFLKSSSPIPPQYYDTEDESEFDYEEELWRLDAEEHLKLSIQQLTDLINCFFYPLLAKFLGRRTAHTIWRNVAEHIFK